jgi:hypothetical protein
MEFILCPVINDAKLKTVNIRIERPLLSLPDGVVVKEKKITVDCI